MTAVRRVCTGLAVAGVCFGSCAGPGGPTGDPSASPTPGPTWSTPLAWREVDGGPAFYDAFDPTLPAEQRAFPIGVWLESVTDPGDVRLDLAAGLTTYVDLTTDSDLALLDGTGLAALVGREDPRAAGGVLADEVDMWAGAGENGWTGLWPGQGEVCDPANTPCGYTVQAAVRAGLPADALTYANYGKGVAFRLDDAEAARFVNDYADVVSVDTYWFTDPHICGGHEGGMLLAGGQPLTERECRRPANYGRTVDRVRSLVDPPGSRPVWAFVELGHPFSEDDAPTITGPQVRAAVWSSVIHGARGVVYFNHSFGGACESFHLLREACGADVRPWVTDVNRQLTALGPALAAPFLDGAVLADGPVDTAVKVDGETQYLLAAATGDGAATVRFDLRCAADGTVTVLGEDRDLALADGAFADTFADGLAVHLYRYDHAPDAAPGCAAP
ncbi:hypothetical protein [Cellulomonas sp. PS-H5]|uniref:hypothetical protein n=1 Tax=Cellulomonas sp. PS-H5 TaxID=2820400 RepID=UPI001C4EDA30|nr:hypothetical protein [Cellulomonas sp. PS-H5]MBW0256406.1 hypothetical protein [Cellulomonas sp. PS-H5]